MVRQGARTHQFRPARKFVMRRIRTQRGHGGRSEKWPKGDVIHTTASETNRTSVGGDLNNRAHQLEDAALMLGNLRLDQLFAIRAQAFESPRLILFHEPAIADQVSGQDGSKAALGAFLHHVVLPSENAVREIVLAPRRKVYRAGLPRWVGHQLTSGDGSARSALPFTTDIDEMQGRVRFVPRRDTASTTFATPPM